MKRYCVRHGSDIVYKGYNESIARIIYDEHKDRGATMTTEELDKDIDTDIYLLDMMLDRLGHKIDSRFRERPECMEDLLDELVEWIDDRRGNEDE